MGAGKGQNQRIKVQAELVRLWLDDVRTPPDKTWTWVKTATEARKLLQQGCVVEVSLDHDLGIVDEADKKETGYYFCLWMAENNFWPQKRVAVHSMNSVGAQRMLGVIKRYAPKQVSSQWVPLKRGK